MRYSKVNPGFRYLASEVGESITRGGIVDKSPVPVLDAEEYLRIRATVDASAAGGLVNPPAAPQVIALQPNRGSRVLPLFNLVPTKGEEAAAAEEGDRTEAADATPYGTALPQSNVSFTRTVRGYKRVGVWVEATKGILDDSRIFDDVVTTVMEQDFDRIADSLALTGDGTGERVTGILDDSWDVPTSDLSTSLRSVHFRAALETVREADHTGPLDAVIHPAALLAMIEETDEAGFHTWKRELAEEFGFRSFVTSTLIDDGTAVVADFATLATVYLRDPGISIAVSQDHSDFLVTGKVAITVEGRWAFDVPRPSAGVVLTGLSD